MVPCRREVGPLPRAQGGVQVAAPCSSSAAVVAAPCSSSAAVVGTLALVGAFQRVPSWQRSWGEACSAMLPEKLGVASVYGQQVVRGPKQRAGWSCASLPSIRPWCWRGGLRVMRQARFGACCIGVVVVDIAPVSQEIMPVFVPLEWGQWAEGSSHAI
jgi:hypothetical protein